MSFSLSISGHCGDVEDAERVDELCREAGADLVAAIKDLGVTPSTAYFTGPSGSVDWLAAAEPEPESESESESESELAEEPTPEEG